MWDSMTFMQLSVSDDRIHYDVDEPRLQAGLSPGGKGGTGDTFFVG